MTGRPGASMRVLFLCTGNSARSQMAETILRQLSHGRIEAFSAGTSPRAEIEPLAREAIRRVLKVEMDGQEPKPLAPFVRQPFDFVITVCDRAAESCPVFPGDPERIHWGFADPAAVVGSEDERSRAFETVARQLVGRMRIWMSLPRLREAMDAPPPSPTAIHLVDDGGNKKS